MATPQTTSDGSGAHTTLSERDSKALLAEYGVPIAVERVVRHRRRGGRRRRRARLPGRRQAQRRCHRPQDRARAGEAAPRRDRAAVEAAAADLLGAATPDDGDVSVLVAPMISGNRELIAGIVRDPQFGPTVMLGVGGILAEAVADVVFRPAPVDARHGRRA